MFSVILIDVAVNKPELNRIALDVSAAGSGMFTYVFSMDTEPERVMAILALDACCFLGVIAWASTTTIDLAKWSWEISFAGLVAVIVGYWFLPLSTYARVVPFYPLLYTAAMVQPHMRDKTIHGIQSSSTVFDAASLLMGYPLSTIMALAAQN